MSSRWCSTVYRRNVPAVNGYCASTMIQPTYTMQTNRAVQQQNAKDGRRIQLAHFRRLVSLVEVLGCVVGDDSHNIVSIGCMMVVRDNDRSNSPILTIHQLRVKIGRFLGHSRCSNSTRCLVVLFRDNNVNVLQVWERLSQPIDARVLGVDYLSSRDDQPGGHDHPTQVVRCKHLIQRNT